MSSKNVKRCVRIPVGTFGKQPKPRLFTTGTPTRVAHTRADETVGDFRRTRGTSRQSSRVDVENTKKRANKTLNYNVDDNRILDQKLDDLRWFIYGIGWDWSLFLILQSYDEQ